MRARIAGEAPPGRLQSFPTENDCFAVRLAGALRQRFGPQALVLAERRLATAVARDQIIKADLYLAVTVILRDANGLFGRSRAMA